MGILAAREIWTRRSRARRARVADFRRYLPDTGGELGPAGCEEDGRTSSEFQGFRKDSIGLLSVRTSCMEDLADFVGLIDGGEGVGEAARLGECMLLARLRTE